MRCNTSTTNKEIWVIENELTKFESISIGRHELLICHNNSDGTDDIHTPRTHIGHCRNCFLISVHFWSLSVSLSQSHTNRPSYPLTTTNNKIPAGYHNYNRITNDQIRSLQRKAETTRYQYRDLLHWTRTYTLTTPNKLIQKTKQKNHNKQWREIQSNIQKQWGIGIGNSDGEGVSCEERENRYRSECV